MNKLYNDFDTSPTKEIENGKKVKVKRPMFDIPLLIIILTLLVFGLVMLYSASYAVAYYRKDGDSTFYISRQLVFAVLGLVLMFLASKVDYHVYHKLVIPVYIVSILLLIVVLFMDKINGARRWITLPVGGTFQPSEIAKFAIILAFAHLISRNYQRLKTFKYGVLSFAMLLVPIVILMLLEPHLSGTVLILGIAAIMMFVGGTALKWFVIGGA
ncbi:MAG: FtsW/RodA/SpoVE family cell cycle protein, partial [Oscillospiraceae bacterium]